MSVKSRDDVKTSEDKGRNDVLRPLFVPQEGVVIVDSPGVGDSNTLSRQLELYMARAFGFIYVINVSNAGGIHRDRVRRVDFKLRYILM